MAPHLVIVFYVAWYFRYKNIAIKLLSSTLIKVTYMRNIDSIIDSKILIPYLIKHERVATKQFFLIVVEQKQTIRIMIMTINHHKSHLVISVFTSTKYQMQISSI